MDTQQPLTRLADGTVKQVNPFSGTEVWTVAGRANRPLDRVAPPAEPIDPEQAGRHCAFCESRYPETTPERERVIRTDSGGWRRIQGLPADQLATAPVAEFRVIPNLFEIVSFDYWVLNHGYRPDPRAVAHHRDYLATPAGRDHLAGLVRTRLRAAGRSDADLAAVPEDELLADAMRFFAGCHDVVVARRHFVDDATRADQMAGAGTLTPQEHRQYVAITIRTMLRLYESNPQARLVAAFQNWLRPAGASFDHLHKQLVAVDAYGTDLVAQLERLEDEPRMYERWGPRYAAEQGLVVASNRHAIITAGVGHRFPALEVWCTVPGRPWELGAEVVSDFSDLLHAVHAVTGVVVPNNEEWHHQPPEVQIASPMRVVVKWRVATLAGFEGGTRIYLNTIDPWTIQQQAAERLRALVEQGIVADGIRLG